MISPQVNKPSTFVIIQLSETEKIMQTLQAAIELRQSHPEIELRLVCLEVFARPISFKLEEVFTEIIYLDFTQLLGVKDQKDLSDVKLDFKNAIARINSTTIDVAINLSDSKTSSYLMSLINSRYFLGPICNRQNEIIINDTWSQFVYTSKISGPYGAFNLVDLFKKIFGTNYNSYIKGHRKLKRKKIIIAPFASYRKGKWAMGKWSEVLYQTLKTHPDCSIVVIGEDKDRDEANYILHNPILQRFQKNLIDSIGSKNIKKTYNEFKNATLFVGYNSQGGHFASLFNVQTLTIALGTNRPHETTPYGNSNYNIFSRINCFPCMPDYKCDMLPCHQDMSHNVISAVIDLLLRGKNVNLDGLKDKVSPTLLDKVDIYRTYLDNNWGMTMKNTLHEEETILEVFRNFYRILWSLILADLDITIPFPKISLKKSHVLKNYLTGLGHVIELNKFGRTYARYIIEETELKTPNIKSIKKYSGRLLEVNQFLTRLLAVYPHLSPLINFYHISNANTPGTTVKEIAESSFITYHEALGASEALKELITSTLKNSDYKDDILPEKKNNSKEVSSKKNIDH